MPQNRIGLNGNCPPSHLKQKQIRDSRPEEFAVRFRWKILAICLGLAALPPWPRGASADDSPRASSGSTGDAAKADFSKDMVPFLARYCTSCHKGARAKAKLA